MSIQSEAALEAGLIATLRQMNYEYVQIVEEDNLYANFKRQLEIHNKKQLAEVGRTSFTDGYVEMILIHNSATYSRNSLARDCLTSLGGLLF